MVLTIDVGNSNIVLGIYKDDNLYDSFRLTTDKRKTEDEYLAIISGILLSGGINNNDIDAAIISSVVPDVTRVLSNAVFNFAKVKPLIVGPGIKTGLDIRIDDPSQLGSDLVVGAVAAINYYGAPAIVIDMGTATTFSAIDKSGAFLGGTIVPGIALSMNALALNAAQISPIDIIKPKNVIGKNTRDSYQSGIVYSNAGMVDAMIEHFEKEMKEDNIKIIATGGLCETIIPYCKNADRITIDKDLIPKGLYHLYIKNKK